MAKPGDTGLTRIIRAAGYSFQGFRAAWRYESAFRQETLLGLALTPVAFWLGRDAVEVALLIGVLLLVVVVELLIGVLLLVVVVELLNSGIEAVVDRIGDEPHRLSGRAKDLGSAAVFLTLLLTFSLWLWFAIDRFLL